MHLDSIHHVAINASNYQRTKEFYVEKLGFIIIREHYRKDKNDIKIDLQFKNQELEIFISDIFPARPSYPEALSLRHLAFKVVSVEEMVKELEMKQISCEPIRTDDFTGEKMTFFFDPDVLPLEIHE